MSIDYPSEITTSADDSDNGWVLEELIKEEDIRTRVAELGQEITENYQGKTPILIGVLNGCFIFIADLIREIGVDCEVDFIKLSSYMDQTRSSGTVRLVKDISCNITDRDVIVVEDIVDSGLTVNFLKNRMEGSSASSVSIVTLLFKEDVAELDFDIDYVGFSIPNDFVVGYGLDLDQNFRKLPSIYSVKKG